MNLETHQTSCGLRSRHEEEVWHDYGLVLWHVGRHMEAAHNLQNAIITNPNFPKGRIRGYPTGDMPFGNIWNLVLSWVSSQEGFKLVPTESSTFINAFHGATRPTYWSSVSTKKSKACPELRKTGPWDLAFGTFPGNPPKLLPSLWFGHVVKHVPAVCHPQVPGHNNLACALVMLGLSNQPVNTQLVQQGLQAAEQAITLAPHVPLYWRNAAVLLGLAGEQSVAWQVEAVTWLVGPAIWGKYVEKIAMGLLIIGSIRLYGSIFYMVFCTNPGLGCLGTLPAVWPQDGGHGRGGLARKCRGDINNGLEKIYHQQISDINSSFLISTMYGDNMCMCVSVCVCVPENVSMVTFANLRDHPIVARAATTSEGRRKVSMDAPNH